MMSFPNREDSIKRPVEGLSRCKGAKVASSISASKRSGNASCDLPIYYVRLSTHATDKTPGKFPNQPVV